MGAATAYVRREEGLRRVMHSEHIRGCRDDTPEDISNTQSHLFESSLH
jgi:hypothetical protein